MFTQICKSTKMKQDHILYTVHSIHKISVWILLTQFFYRWHKHLVCYLQISENIPEKYSLSWENFYKKYTICQHKPAALWVPETASLGIQQQEHEAEVKNGAAIPQLSHNASWCYAQLIKPRNNFTLHKYLPHIWDFMYLFFPSTNFVTPIAWAKLTVEKLYSIQERQLWLHTSTETVNRGRAQAKKLFYGEISVTYQQETVKGPSKRLNMRISSLFPPFFIFV